MYLHAFLSAVLTRCLFISSIYHVNSHLFLGFSHYRSKYLGHSDYFANVAQRKNVLVIQLCPFVVDRSVVYYLDRSKGALHLIKSVLFMRKDKLRIQWD